MPAICRVITGVSGSRRGFPALRYAAALARGYSATLIPVLAWLPPGTEVAYCKGPTGHLRPVWEQDAQERLWAALTTALGGVPADVATEPLVVCGGAGRVLLETASWQGDLLVIGTGRQGSLGRLAGGGVSRYCMARAGCPVLAVPPSPLELEARHGWRSWVFRHRGLSAGDLTASASGTGGPSSRRLQVRWVVRALGQAGGARTQQPARARPQRTSRRSGAFAEWSGIEVLLLRGTAFPT
jgi:nucleotide-binding universal stress UspA family protein